MCYKHFFFSIINTNFVLTNHIETTASALRLRSTLFAAGLLGVFVNRIAPMYPYKLNYYY